MISHPRMRNSLATVLMCLTGIASFTTLAEEAGVEGVILNQPGITGLLDRLLADPHRDYHGVWGPDDCNSEDTYLGTRNQLSEYAANPVEKKSALKDYILSGQAQCNCTRAIVGKEMDILVEDVGLNMSDLPCI